jgi:hypothetical protein
MLYVERDFIEGYSIPHLGPRARCCFQASPRFYYSSAKMAKETMASTNLVSGATPWLSQKITFSIMTVVGVVVLIWVV